MPENEQQLGQQTRIEPIALKGINRLIEANKRDGQMDSMQEQDLVEGLRALADLPHPDFKRIAQEQRGERSGGKRLA